MVKALNITAIVFILLGVISFVITIQGISDAKKDSEFWQVAAKKSSSNELIQNQADNAKRLYVSKITISASVLFSGIVVGLFFMALSKVISVLEEIRDVNKIKQVSTLYGGQVAPISPSV